MLIGEIRNKVDTIWEVFWTGGVTNPLSVIEQITYLLFIRGLDDLEIKNEKESSVLGIKFERVFPRDRQYLKWSQFKNFEAGKMYKIVSEEVFPFIKDLDGNEKSAYSKYMSDAIFIIPTPQMLEKIVTGLSEIPMDDIDIKGDLYEYLLSKLSQSGTNGQLRTPRHIIRMMVRLMKPTPEDIIIDPAVGERAIIMTRCELRNSTRKCAVSSWKHRNIFSLVSF